MASSAGVAATMPSSSISSTSSRTSSSSSSSSSSSTNSISSTSSGGAGHTGTDDSNSSKTWSRSLGRDPSSSSSSKDDGSLPADWSYHNRTVLAPMVRMGTLPFRLLAARYGADMC